MIAAQLGFRAWALSGSWFQFDDFAFITRVIDHPLTQDLLFDGYGGHLMPAGFAFTWLFVRHDALDFEPYAVTLLVLQALASIGFLALLRSLFGSRWGILPPLALYLFSAISLPAFIWWAAGINQLALQVALTWGLLAHLAYLRTRKLRWVLATTLVMVSTLAFYEKVLLVYGAMSIVTLAYFTTGTFFQRLGQVWTRYRAGLLVAVVCGAGYIALYVATALELPGGETGRYPFLALTGNMVGRSLIPALFGGPIDWSVLTGPFQLADPVTPMVIAACVAAGALVIHIDQSYERSRRAWVLPLFFLGSDIALIGSARASVLGSIIGLEFRYLTELGLVFALALALSTMPVQGAAESAERIRASSFLDSREWVSVSSVVVCLLALFSSYRYAEHWQDSNQAHRYFTNAARTLGTPQEPTPLANVSVPQYIMWGFDYPRNTTRYVLRMYGSRMTFPQAGVDNLYLVADDGKVEPAAISTARASIPPPGDCAYRSTTTQAASLPLDGPVTGKDWWVRMSYLADKDTQVTITAGDAVHDIELPDGLRNVYFQAEGDFTDIEVASSTPGTRLCLVDAVVGLPQALPPGSAS